MSKLKFNSILEERVNNLKNVPRTAKLILLNSHYGSFGEVKPTLKTR